VLHQQDEVIWVTLAGRQAPDVAGPRVDPSLGNLIDKDFLIGIANYLRRFGVSAKVRVGTDVLRERNVHVVHGQTRVGEVVDEIRWCISDDNGHGKSSRHSGNTILDLQGIGIWFSGPGPERLLPGLVSRWKKTLDQLGARLEGS
jgi:hypothetical protein